MRRRDFWFLFGLATICLFSFPSPATERSVTPGRFPQKVIKKYPLAPASGSWNFVTSVAVCGERVFAGTEIGVWELKEENWSGVSWGNLPGVRRLASDKENLFVISRAGVFKVALAEENHIRKIFSGEVTALASKGDNGYLVGTRRGLFVLKGERPEKFSALTEAEVIDLEVGAEGKIWVACDRGLISLEGERVRDWSAQAPEPISPLLKSGVRDLALDGEGNVFLATGKGIIRFDGKSHWQIITGKNGGLPYEDTLALSFQKNILWVGTSFGAARYDGKEWQYLQGLEYLLNDRVVDISPDEDGAWLATPRGITKVESREMTLEEKARYFEKVTRARHVRHGLVSDSRLLRPGDLSTNTTFTSDNDGLWTAMYIAAECYRFAATGEPEARTFARESLQALMFLEEVTGIPGFIARSFAHPNEPHDEGEWDHLTPDGKWRWKGDTSSDEVVGHYYAYSIYYDLCAEEGEKEKIREKVRRITDYIMTHDYFLLDTDGQPTRWGRWNFYRPFYRRFRFWDRGLNSLEILSHLKVAYHITGDEKYQRAYLELALNHDYAKFTVRQKINIPGAINHSDDELAFLSYYPLLKYEKDPQLLKFYHASLERSFAIERPERCPLFNFIYGAVMPEGRDFALEDAIFTLERISLDLVRWDHKNSHRADIKLKIARGRFQELESVVPLPPDERSVMKWNGNPYALDTGQGGRVEEAGTFWLLPYWMGRAYGFIREK